MSVSFDRIYCNEQLKKHFESSVEAGNLSHAMIFEGAKGSGRYTFAKEIALAMSCTSGNRPCRSCINCRKTEQGLNPDIITLGLPEGKATIPVELIREIKSMALTFPTEGEYKFFIIRDAEKMTVQAQNAFLKILEEPPSFVVFILLCTNASLMLPTVISRAPVFRMQKLTSEELRAYFANDEKAMRFARSDPEGFDYLIRAAGGTIGKALENMDKRSMTKAAKHYEAVTDFLEALLHSDKADFITNEAESNIKTREELDIFVSDVRMAARDIMLVRSGGASELLFFVSEDKPKSYASSLTLRSIVDMIDCCDNILRSNEQNANVNLLKINFMSKLRSCVHS